MTDNAISLAARQALIKGLVCFSMLNKNQIQELATLMKLVEYAPGSRIVIEDELVDRVYIVAHGQAEVTHRTQGKNPLKKKSLEAPIALMGPGDSIGLNETGFFSETGKRTATVTALTDIKLLALDLKILHDFLKKYPDLQGEMLAAAGQMLRVRLIRQTLPFAKISYERTQWLAQQVEELTMPADSIIFRQGEKGDRCYLIRSGKVEITATEEDGSEKHLAMLKAPAIFGEATLITHDPRNASARAVEDTELLVINQKYLSELVENEASVASMFMTLMVDRSRPLQNPRVSLHYRTTTDGQSIVILKNPDNGNYFKLSQEGLFIWQQLNGKQTMQTITMALSDQWNTFAPDIVAALISKLAKAGFVEHVETSHDMATTKKTFLQSAVSFIRNCLEFRYAFGDADKWLTRAYNKVGKYIFTAWGKTILASIAITGFIVFLFTTGETIDTFKVMPDVWLLFLALVPATIFSVALHEMGHAFATKSFGYEVHYMGVGWFWVSPVAFTDTSDMWLSTRGPRIVVNLAGVMTDTIVAGTCALLILFFTNPYYQVFLWLFALYTYINAFRMLSPLQELDGYYVLMDLVEKPRLRQSAILWLIRGFPKALRHPSLFKKNMPEVWYWLACILFLALITIITLLVQMFVLNIIGIHPNRILSLSLPLIIAVISMIGLIGDIRNQAD